MTTLNRLRARAQTARTTDGTISLTPDQLDALLDVVQHPDILGLDDSVFDTETNQ